MSIYNKHAAEYLHKYEKALRLLRGRHATAYKDNVMCKLREGYVLLHRLDVDKKAKRAFLSNPKKYLNNPNSSFSNIEQEWINNA